MALEVIIIKKDKARKKIAIRVSETTEQRDARLENDKKYKSVLLQNDASADLAKQLLEMQNGKLVIDESTQCITFRTNFCRITATTNKLIDNGQCYRNRQ